MFYHIINVDSERIANLYAEKIRAKGWNFVKEVQTFPIGDKEACIQVSSEDKIGPSGQTMLERVVLRFNWLTLQ